MLPQPWLRRSSGVRFHVDFPSLPSRTLPSKVVFLAFLLCFRAASFRALCSLSGLPFVERAGYLSPAPSSPLYLVASPLKAFRLSLLPQAQSITTHCRQSMMQPWDSCTKFRGGGLVSPRCLPGSRGERVPRPVRAEARVPRGSRAGTEGPQDRPTPPKLTSKVFFEGS